MSSAIDGPFEVLIAVLTYRRPDELARVLPLLVTQAQSLTPPAAVLVVDNDPEGGARVAVEGYSNRDVRYVHEARPGIAGARNRALDMALAAGLQALVFIDDDETPSASWLADLVACWREYSAAAVSGPVKAQFARTPTQWVIESGRFERRRRPTGTTVSTGATNNLLLDLTAVRSAGLRFDESFGLTGGEDTQFTRRLTTTGGRIVWCDQAEVTDHVPADRLNPRWVLRRDFRSGTSWSRIELVAAGGRWAMRTRLSLVVRGAVGVVQGVGQLILGTVSLSVHHRARGACVLASNIGLLGGALGYSFREYRRPNSDATNTSPANEPRTDAHSGRGDCSS